MLCENNFLHMQSAVNLGIRITKLNVVLLRYFASPSCDLLTIHE
ncbi:Uncharacterised protein [Vibrio cholerae]|nr:Uncharacterised protein [Vibrio cholerae]